MDAMVQDMGVLRQVAGDTGADPTIWSGPIGLAVGDEAALAKALGDLNNYFVLVDKAAPARCIDGRQTTGYKDNPSLLTRRLGPQLVGGTPVVALLHHLITTIDDMATTLEQDVAQMVDVLTSLGLGYGGHTDDHHVVTDEDTGCGAADKLPAILSKCMQPQAMVEMKALAAKLLGTAWDEAVADQLPGRLKSFLPDADTYLGRQGDKYTYKQAVVRVLQSKAGPGVAVESLAGTHQEKGLIVNAVARTTFDRDRFVEATKATMQLFSYDVWYLQELAKQLFAADERRRATFFIFHVLYSIATAMVLTDGTLKLLVRQ